MQHRIIFCVLAAFWATMTWLLWRSEFGEREVGTAVPIEKVWEKVLTAPDDSSLDIFHRRKKIGICRWSPNVGEDAATTGRISTYEFQPEGLIKDVSHYSIDVDGNVNLESVDGNLRFDFGMTFSTNQNWESFRLRLSVRPYSWEVRADRATEKMTLEIEDDETSTTREFSFDELRNPETLLNELAGPFALPWLGGLGLGTGSTNQQAKLGLGLQWEAHNDWMRFGHSRVRVYRIEARLLDNLKIFVFVSRVGEILWVHLPDELVLSNNAFEHF